MLVKDLQPGQIVILEFVIDGEYKYEIITRVVGAQEEGLLVEPIEYKDRVIEFNGRKIKSVVFNLFADDLDKNRVKWLNVDMEVKTYKGRNYYVIHTKAFNRDSVYSDRRNGNRISVSGIIGELTLRDQEPIQVDLFDISSAGVSFITDMLEDAGGRGILHFEDTLKGERYVLNLKCQYVRQTKMENGKQLYGFSIFDVDRKLLSYLFFKPLFDENGVAAHPAIDKLFDVASDSEKASTEQSGTDTVDNSVVSGIEEKTEEVDNNTALKGEQVAVEISAKTEEE